MQRILLVLVGGGLGSVSRYGTTVWLARLWGTSYPWGTLAVNGIGCLLIGASYALAEHRDLLGPSGRLFFMTGFLGGLTTFSTFALETANMAKADTMTTALVNLLAHNIGGIALVIVGMWLVRVLL